MFISFLYGSNWPNRGPAAPLTPDTRLRGRSRCVAAKARNLKPVIGFAEIHLRGKTAAAKFE
jgi:hypothetical protein